MINYEGLEDDIVARLSSFVGVDAEHLPDTEKDVSKPFLKSRITVAYRASEYDREVVRGQAQQMTLGGISSQEQYASVDIFIRARKLRGENGCYDLLSKIKELLFGYKPTNFGKITIESDRFVENDEKEGVFTYVLTIITRTLVVEKVNAEDLPTLTNVTFDIENGNAG